MAAGFPGDGAEGLHEPSALRPVPLPQVPLMALWGRQPRPLSGRRDPNESVITAEPSYRTLPSSPAHSSAPPGDLRAPPVRGRGGARPRGRRRVARGGRDFVRRAGAAGERGGGAAPGGGGGAGVAGGGADGARPGAGGGAPGRAQ